MIKNFNYNDQIFFILIAVYLKLLEKGTEKLTTTVTYQSAPP